LPEKLILIRIILNRNTRLQSNFN